MLFKIYLASVIACNVSLIFYIYRLKKLVFKRLTPLNLFLSYCILAMTGFIPLANLYFGLTWFINAFITSDSEFIDVSIEE